MLGRLDLRGNSGDLRQVLPRPESLEDGPIVAVQAILAAVRDRGDAALREFSEQFDHVVLEEIRVPIDEIRAAPDQLDPPLRAALEAAAEGIEDFHRHQLSDDAVYERDGIVIEERQQPVDRAGCYVPGGRAVYPSTVLMTAIPARVAGVPEIALCVPPDASGRVPLPTLAAAAIAGVDEVYRIGGAQAIGAMAFGTESVPAVDVIVGPGNVYVALAKREVAGAVGVPSAFAGPSEVVVVADDTTDAGLAAVDVILQAEHGPGGLAWLVTWSESAADAITTEIEHQVAGAVRRDDIAATFATGGHAVVCVGPDQAAAVINLIAPEHLELLNEDPRALLPLIRHAGAIFCGPWAPASVGDYIAGPSHVLPTAGTARFSGALTVRDFQKPIHVITLDAAALAKVTPHVEAIATAEGLAAHADSVRRRRGR